MPTITIRNIDSITNKRLCEMAKDQGLSKEEFLRRKLKEITLLEFQNIEIDKYKNLVEYVTNVIENNTNVLNRIERSLNEK